MTITSTLEVEPLEGYTTAVRLTETDVALVAAVLVDLADSQPLLERIGYDATRIPWGIVKRDQIESVWRWYTLTLAEAAVLATLLDAWVLACPEAAHSVTATVLAGELRNLAS